MNKIEELLKAYASSMSLNEQLFQAGENSKSTRDIDDEVSINRAKSLLKAEILKVIDGQEIDVEVTRERMIELGASENEIMNMEIEASDTKDTLDGVRTKLKELFNVKEK